MEKKVLIIGYGSIGNKHASILNKINNVVKIKVISNNKHCKFEKIVFSKKDIQNYNPDYIIISNETYKHYSTFKKINSFLNKKSILIEKPLFKKYTKIKFKLKNKVFVGYNLRFSPLTLKLKNYIDKNSFNFMSAICFSDVKKWRKNRKFEDTYSSKKAHGGGVALDLSHEIDLLQYLVGKFKVKNSFKRKISKLKGNVEDTFFLNAYKKNKILQAQINFSSKLNYRKIFVIGKDYSIILDFKKDFLLIKKNKQSKKYFFKNNISQSYLKMHKALLKNNYKNFCSFSQGHYINKIIDQAKNN